MKTHATGRIDASGGGTLYGLYVLALGAAGGGNLLIRLLAEAGWLGGPGRIALGVAAVFPLMVAAAMFWRLLQTDLDEMVQRIVLEGMAFALTVYVPLAALFVNLKTAGAWVPRLDPPDLLFGPAFLVALGIFLAWRRRQ
jgi:hypothetical protein